jgi:hypothetical protein
MKKYKVKTPTVEITTYFIYQVLLNNVPLFSFLTTADKEYTEQFIDIWYKESEDKDFLLKLFEIGGYEFKFYEEEVSNNCNKIYLTE